MSKTLPILRFLATGAEETNKSDFRVTGFSIISFCRLEVLAKGLRPFFPLTYIKIDKLDPSVISIIIGVIKKNNIFRMMLLGVATTYFKMICQNTEYYSVYFYRKEGT